MENFGADVYASPTDRTHAGRAALATDPNNPGSLGLAITEAVEVAATSGGATKYSLGSVLGHVLLHQSVIGLEALEQMEMAGEAYHHGQLEEYEYPAEAIAEAMQHLPKVPAM